eukprot:Hpha_TRINITY_DN16182_c1_g3::TRINITY_DN16182_c1_g3_i1::g.8082::m.8082
MGARSELEMEQCVINLTKVTKHCDPRVAEGISVGEGVPRIDQLNAVRLSRAHCVRLLCRQDTSSDDVFRGCFVRVLLETSTRTSQQQYRIARIQGTQEGEAYGGYSRDEELTTTYLTLDVSSSASSRGHIIQLNSISNSDFTASEYAEWIDRVSNDDLPCVSELAPKCRELARIFGDHTARALVKPFRLNPAPVTKDFLGKKQCVQPHPRESALQVAQRTIAFQSQEIADLQRRLEARHEFPKDLDPLETNALFALEEEVANYLTELRQRRRDLNQCKCCMSKESDVVLLPCRHQAMCRDCERRVTHCPLCRTYIEDRIYPHRG